MSIVIKLGQSIAKPCFNGKYLIGKCNRFLEKKFKLLNINFLSKGLCLKNVVFQTPDDQQFRIVIVAAWGPGVPAIGFRFSPRLLPSAEVPDRALREGSQNYGTDIINSSKQLNCS